MRAGRIVLALGIGWWLVCAAGVAQAEVEMEWVRVGDPGNTGEWSGSGYGGWGVARLCGAVDYEYRIGKYEVTNAQYCEFLNAVASVDDPNQLFAHLAAAPENDTIGIYRSGTLGDYTYTLRPGREDHPVTFVTFLSAARFANWLHNGQPVGAQDETTTEDGAYDMSLGDDVVRKPGAQVFLPSEDEWYKAAFYDASRHDYWLYPTQTDDEPTFEAPPGTDLVNGSANHGLYGIIVPSTNTVPVGSYTYKPTTSPYGAHDQMGNVREWTETLMRPGSTDRNTRGGGYNSIYIEWSWSVSRVGAAPSNRYPSLGIRVASLVDGGVCGDGDLNYGEFCDDGNQISGDGCSAGCVVEYCGDGILQLGIGETCDDGNRMDGDWCDSNCQRESWFCGDGILREDLGEVCDDGNTVDGDGCAGDCSGVISLDWAIVGDVGNSAEWSGLAGGGSGPSRACGAVDYIYKISATEVTNLEYCSFLNAVAADDPNDLYFWAMAGGIATDVGGIERHGVSGSYTYTLRPGREHRPVSMVNFFDALRFANWLHNGQPVGAQDATTTEDGAYDMSLGNVVVRKPDAQAFLTSEDEWYKAAYYDPAISGYWLYATQSDDPPKPEDPPGTDMADGSANFAFLGYVDPVYFATEVGAYTFKPSTSAWGTWDQAGNMWEWTETDMAGGTGETRNIRGGSFDCDVLPCLRANYRTMGTAGSHYSAIGFRVGAAYESNCGDGFQDPEEECDDGNFASGDGCNSLCIIEFCGDGITQPLLDEACDDGNTISGDGCTYDCLIEACGDGITQPETGELCDDGNTIGGDGCDANCLTEVCGNGALQPAIGEACDDGNLMDGDGCNAYCEIEYCGDGILQEGIGEQCEDGNTIGGDGCDGDCIWEVCGNGVHQPEAGETCDDGNTIDDDGCSASCDLELCGDGIVQAGIGEQCDDANTVGGDGCDSDCIEEICGNGVTQFDAGEECDDGNTINGDGCDGSCQYEGYVCASHVDCVLHNNNVCEWDACNLEIHICHEPISMIFGDICGSDFSVPPNGVVNLTDVLCTLNAFGLGNLVNCPNADVAIVSASECPQGNGVVNLTDILKVLDAFGTPVSPTAILFCDCPANP